VTLLLTVLFISCAAAVILNVPDRFVQGRRRADNTLEREILDTQVEVTADSASFRERNTALYFGDHNADSLTVELWLESTEEIGGFQTQVTGLHLTDVITEDVAECGWMLAWNPSGLILSFSLLTDCSPGIYQAATLIYDYTTAGEACISDTHVSGHYGQPLEVNEGPCIPLDYCDLSGDMNGDAELNILDVTLTVDCILQDDECVCADINYDMIVDVLDIVTLILIILEE